MAEGEEPGDYIHQRKEFHDCFFLVGSVKKERISTVKYFLANYSSYFRAMLVESDMKEKNSKEDIIFPDHEPDVFKLMLSYVYGCHDIKFKNVDQAMRFHILVDMCLMPKLKNISSQYLLENCRSNLCNVLDCAVLLGIKEIEPRAKEILEKDTQNLLTSRDFLNANPAIVEFIVKQDGLNATEVDVWRALVKWAKHQSEHKQGGNALRQKIGNVIKHVNFLKMSLKEFAEDVVPTSILTSAETIDIFVKMATGKGNVFEEAPSKTRRMWSSPYACIASFTITGNNVAALQNGFECHYAIQNQSSQRLRITFIKFRSFSAVQNGSYFLDIWLSCMGTDQQYKKTASTSSLPLSITNQSTAYQYQAVWANSQQSVVSVIPDLELPDDFIVKASKQYVLSIKVSRGRQSIDYNYRYFSVSNSIMSASVNPNICKVSLSNDGNGRGYYHSSGRYESVIESITFSFF